MDAAQVGNLPAFDHGQGGAEIADDDSTFGDIPMTSETRTLASFLTDYRYENGRRYHAYQDGAYWGPNDDRANDLQNLTHHMYYLTFGGRLHLAPVETPQHVLDVGTGNGVWAIDYADENPNALVVGNDLSPIQPELIPPNCTFEVDDVTQLWTHPENYFDFIHIREMFGSIPDWDLFFEQSFRHTRPGGWVEITETSCRPLAFDGTTPPGHFYHEWIARVEQCGKATGKTFTIFEEAKTRMEKAGFKEVREFRFIWPIGGWAKDPHLRELGRWNQYRLHEGCEGWMLRLLTSVIGVSSDQDSNWTLERAHAFLAQFREAVLEKDTHALVEGSVVYGRKPL